MSFKEEPLIGETFPVTIHNENYLEKDTSVKVIIYKNHFIQWITNFFGISVKYGQGTESVNVSSVAQTICDTFFQGLQSEDQKKAREVKLAEIKTIIKQTAANKKHQELKFLIDDVLQGLSQHETYKERSLSDIVTNALDQLPTNLEEAKSLKNALVEIQAIPSMLHPIQTVIGGVINQVKLLEIKNKLQMMKETCLSTKILLDKPYLKDDEATVSAFKKELAKLTEQIEQAIIPNTLTEDLSSSFTSVTEKIGLFIFKKLQIHTGKKETPFSMENIFVLDKMYDEQEQASKIEDETRQNTTARETLQTIDLTSTLEQIIKNILAEEQPKTEIIQAALTFQKHKIKETTEEEPFKEELKILEALLRKTRDNFVSSINSLLTSIDPEKKDLINKIVDHFKNSSISETITIEDLKELHSEMHKIIALNKTINQAIRFQAAALYIADNTENGIKVLQELLQEDLSISDQEILSVLRNLSIDSLRKIFAQDNLRLPRDRLRKIAYEERGELKKNLSKIFGFNFEPIKETEKTISSLSKKTTIIALPIEATLNAYRKALMLEISKYRESSVENLHPIAIGTLFNVENQKKYKEALLAFQQLSNDFKGILIIPKIHIWDSNQDFVPVFEDGRLIHMRTDEDIKQGTPGFFLCPNGTSVALGVGANAFKDTPRFPIDCQIAIDATDTPPINESGFFIKASQTKPITVISSSKSVNDSIINFKEKESPPLYYEPRQPSLKIAEEKDAILKIINNDEHKLLFSSEEDKKTFIERLATGQLSPQYVEQFLILLSKVRRHPIVVYTENSSIPVFIYVDGKCAPWTGNNFQEILPGKDRTLLTYSSEKSSFYTIPPNLLELPIFTEAKQRVQKDSTQQKIELYRQLSVVTKKATSLFDQASISEFKKSIDDLSLKLKALEPSKDSSKGIPEAYWKQQKQDDYEKLQKSVQQITEYCALLRKLCEELNTKDKNPINTLSDLLKRETSLFESLQSIAPNRKDQIDFLGKLTTIPRLWDTILTLRDIAENENAAELVIAQEGRLLLQQRGLLQSRTQPDETPSQIEYTLRNLQEALKSASKILDPSTKELLLKGLRILTKPSEKLTTSWIPFFRRQKLPAPSEEGTLTRYIKELITYLGGE